MTSAVRDQESASTSRPSSIANDPRKIDAEPAEITHPLATGRYQSPLRYPGAKSGLAKVIGKLITSAERSEQVQRVKLLVEPFAGGASATLRLIGSGIVERALLADADPLVATFWQVAAARTEELVERITDEHVRYVTPGGAEALARWDYWRAWSAQPGIKETTSDLEVATKCLFLNRTTFSGILHGRAGPIGGRAQASQYRIGCRFTLDPLIDRLRYVGHLYETGRLVDVWRSDWKQTLNAVASHYKTLLPNRVVAYLDPPYLTKSGKLYRRSFEVDDQAGTDDLEWMSSLQHLALAQHLRTQMPYRWILSYDHDERLLNDDALYAANVMQPEMSARELMGVKAWRISKRTVSLNYTASSRTGRGPARELLLTTLPPSTVPTDDQLRTVMSQGT